MFCHLFFHLRKVRLFLHVRSCHTQVLGRGTKFLQFVLPNTSSPTYRHTQFVLHVCMGQVFGVVCGLGVRIPVEGDDVLSCKRVQYQ